MSHLNRYGPLLSVIVAVMNEEENIQPLVEKVFSSLKWIDFELIFVDDGSTDNTVREIKKINDPRVKLVVLRKNYGQSAALSCGIDQARGEFLVTMDGDLQNDPSDIPLMLQLLHDGEWDLVAGQRKNRKDGFLLRKIPSRVANAIIRHTTGVHLKDYGCTLKLFRADIAKELGLYGELHRFIPVLARLQGARMTQVEVKHHARMHGRSKYGINRTFKVMSDLLLVLFLQKYMQRPIHLFGTLGIGIFGLGAIIDLYLVYLKLLGQDIWGKPLMLLGIMLTIGGIQFITIGIMTEVMMRTYYESQGKKPYKIRNIIVGREQAETVHKPVH